MESSVKAKIVDQIQHIVRHAVIRDRRFLDDEQLIRAEQLAVLEEVFNSNVRDTEKAGRKVPLFPELRAVLLEGFEAADDGAEFVVDRYRDSTANLRTHMIRIIKRAGLKPWPRLFNALRASRATELAGEYPAAVCSAWLGHSTAIAEAHYHMVRDSDVERAVRGPGLAPFSAPSRADDARQKPTTRTDQSRSDGSRRGRAVVAGESSGRNRT